MVEHGLHFVPVQDILGYIGGQEHAHDKIDMIECITNSHALDNVLQDSEPPFSGAVVYHVKTVRSGAEITAVAADLHFPLSITVIQCNIFGNSAESLFNHA